MKRVFLTISITVLTLMFASSVFSQPQMTIPDPEFDFGYVPQHSKISHVFWLHSTGTDSLLIKNVKPG